MKKIKEFFSNMHPLDKFIIFECISCLGWLFGAILSFCFDATDLLILGGCFLGISLYKTIILLKNWRFYVHTSELVKSHTDKN